MARPGRVRGVGELLVRMLRNGASAWSREPSVTATTAGRAISGWSAPVAGRAASPVADRVPPPRAPGWLGSRGASSGLVPASAVAAAAQRRPASVTRNGASSAAVGPGVASRGTRAIAASSSRASGSVVAMTRGGVPGRT